MRLKKITAVRGQWEKDEKIDCFTICLIHDYQDCQWNKNITIMNQFN